MKYGLALCLLAACGGDDGNHETIADAHTANLPDAPAAPADAAIAPVTLVTVPPLPNALVYFQNADSTIVAKTMTDANGTASAIMAAGGYATIIDALPDTVTAYYRMYTFGGVKPGDVIEVNPGTGQGGTTPATSTLHVTLPVVAAAKQYEIETTCGTATFTQPATNATSFIATIKSSCSTIDVMVLAETATGDLVSSFAVSDVAITDGAQLDLSTSVYTAPISRTVEVDHDGTSALFGGTFIEGKHGALYFSSLNLPATDPATTMQTLPAAPTTHRNVTWAYASHGMSSPYVYRWGTDGNLTFDWTAETAPAFATAPVLDIATHTVHWTAATGGVTADASGIQGIANRATYSFEWNAFGASADSVTLPVLPTDLADFTLKTSDALPYAIMASYPGGYDALRARVGVGSPYPPATSATGTLAFTTYVPNLTLSR